MEGTSNPGPFAFQNNEFENRIKFFIIKTPSTNVPNRRRRLQTFSEKHGNSTRITQHEKDKRLVLAAIKMKMKYSHQTGKPINQPGEQLILPLAICDHHTTKVLKAYGASKWTKICSDQRCIMSISNVPAIDQLSHTSISDLPTIDQRSRTVISVVPTVNQRSCHREFGSGGNLIKGD